MTDPSGRGKQNYLQEQDQSCFLGSRAQGGLDLALLPWTCLGYSTCDHPQRDGVAWVCVLLLQDRQSWAATLGGAPGPVSLASFLEAGKEPSINFNSVVESRVSFPILEFLLNRKKSYPLE